MPSNPSLTMTPTLRSISNYEFHHRTIFDFGIIAGQATGSPHYGFQLGVSKDFW